MRVLAIVGAAHCLLPISIWVKALAAQSEIVTLV